MAVTSPDAPNRAARRPGRRAQRSQVKCMRKGGVCTARIASAFAHSISRGPAHAQQKPGAVNKIIGWYGKVQRGKALCAKPLRHKKVSARI